MVTLMILTTVARFPISALQTFAIFLRLYTCKVSLPQAPINLRIRIEDILNSIALIHGKLSSDSNTIIK